MLITKVANVFFTIYRGVLYTAIILYLLVAIAPIVFGIQPFMVVSGSMEPTIHTGALVYVNTKDTDVDTGDIIAFTEGNDNEMTVIHRVVADNNDGTLTTKGDANENEDFAPIKAEQVVGTVVFNIPKLGYVTNFLQSIKGIIVAVVLVGIAIVSSFITDSHDESENNLKSEVKSNEE